MQQLIDEIEPQQTLSQLHDKIQRIKKEIKKEKKKEQRHSSDEGDADSDYSEHTTET
jgi:hypothetical protein